MGSHSELSGSIVHMDVPMNGYTLQMDDKKLPTLHSKAVKNKFVSVCVFILILECCERLAYFTVQTNLVVYFQRELKYESSLASMYTAVFGSLVYITPLIGAFIADTYLGRYQTILRFSIIYFIGLVMACVAVWPTVQSSVLLFVSLFGFVTLGTGGIKCNGVTLGADQYDPISEQKEMGSFFNWFYWVSNIGSIVATAFVSDFAIKGGWFISKQYAFAAAFIFAAFAFVIAMVTFFMGRNRYHQKKPSESALSTVASIIKYAAKHEKGHRGKIVLGFLSMLTLCTILNIGLVFVPQGPVLQMITLVSGSMIVCSVLGVIWFGLKNDWVDNVHVVASGHWSQVSIEGTKELMRLVPYIGFMVSFWMVYHTLSGPWINQGCQMDSRVFSDTPYNPGSWSVWDIIIILAFIPILDIWVYPWIGKCTGRGDAGPTPLQKMGAGFVCCILSMIVSGIVEVYRRRSPIVDGLNSICAMDDEFRPVSSLSIWYQVPQYCLLGLGEIFCAVSAYDFFYNQVPEEVKSACQGINLLTAAVGGALTAMIQSICTANGSLTTDLNEGRQEVFYYAQAGVGMLFFLLFLIVSQNFEYKKNQ